MKFFRAVLLFVFMWLLALWLACLGFGMALKWGVDVISECLSE